MRLKDICYNAPFSPKWIIADEPELPYPALVVAPVATSMRHLYCADQHITNIFIRFFFRSNELFWIFISDGELVLSL